MIANIFAALALIFVAVFQLILSPQFSPTWDFPHHLLIGQIELRTVPPPMELYSTPYGVMTDVVPVLFAKLFPLSWFPFSYLLFPVIIGSLGVLVFYFLLKDYFGVRVAFLSSLVVFSLPRFVGHLHTNIKDINTAAFTIMSVYFFHLYHRGNKFIYMLLSIFAFSLAVNTKLTAFQFLPIFIIWSIYDLKNYVYKSGARNRYLIQYIFFNIAILVIPISTWIILWPHWLVSIATALSGIMAGINRMPSHPFYYAVEQLFTTTPLQILIFAPLGLWVLWKKVRHEKHVLSLIFLAMFFYSVLKYPLFGFPLIDDIRYFIEIYYPLSLAFVLGADYFWGKHSTYVITAVIFSLIYLNYLRHPYQINYYNFLAGNKDADFWAASYSALFQYINKEVPKGSIVSAPLAPELANFFIRSDLKEKLNSQNPSKSDYVVILNRASFFAIFGVEEFVATHRPYKVFTDKTGVVLSYLYKLSK